MTRRQVMSKVKAMTGISTHEKNIICSFIGKITEKTNPNIDPNAEEEPKKEPDQKEIVVIEKVHLVEPKITVSEHEVGDVVMHGPLRHPALLLKKSKKQDAWIAILLTSEPKCKDILMPIEYRVGPKNMESFATKCVLTIHDIDKYQYRYTIADKKIIKKIKKELKKVFK